VNKIAIIGLGLIGGSIGLGLKKAASGKVEIHGYDRDMKAGKRAAKIGAVDKAPYKLYDAVKEANMIILAMPVLAIRDMMETIADMISPGCVVTDTGSTKGAIMSWAEEYLPKGVSFVGGHPMAGKELSGIDAADAALFQGSRYVIIPGANASKEATTSVIDLAELLEAKPYFLDASEHDSYVAAVSHLPIIMSSALVSATTRSPSWREISKLASTGFRDVSRLASGDPVMNLDICITNGESIVHWIDQAIGELRSYRDMVAGAVDETGAQKMGEAFTDVWDARERWLLRFESGEDMDDNPTGQPELPSMRDEMMDLFVGSRMRERYQQIMSLQEDKDSRNRRPRDR